MVTHLTHNAAMLIRLRYKSIIDQLKKPATRYQYIFCCSTFFIFSLTAFWPGMFTHDSHVQFYEAKTGYLTNHHAPLLAWWWGILYHHVFKDAGVLLVFNQLLYWGAAYQFSCTIGKHQKLLGYTALILWFTPPMLSMSCAMWKDSGITCAYLLATTTILRAYLDGRTLSKTECLAVFLGLSYATGLRPNTVTALPPLCFLFITCLIPQATLIKKVTVTTVLTIAIFGMTNITNHQLTDKKLNSFENQMMVELTYMSARLNSNLIPEAIQNIIPRNFDKLIRHRKSKKLNYDMQLIHAPDYFLTINRIQRKMRRFTPEESKHLKQSYFQMIRHYPVEYVHHRLTTLQHALQWNLPYTFTTHQWVVKRQNAKKVNFLRKTVGDYFIFTSGTKWLRTWVYLLLCIVICTFSLRRMHMGCKANNAAFFISASGILYFLPFIIILTSGNMRYSYWVFASALLSSTLFLYSKYARPASTA